MSAIVSDPQVHRQLAVQLFNQTWTLMEKADRTAAETDTLIHGAHASCYHWSLVGNATNLSIGEWQISRMYSVLKRPEPALHHARRCLEISETGAVAPFFLGYAHEAMARSLKLAGDPAAATYLENSCRYAEQVTDAEDRKALLADLATL